MGGIAKQTVSALKNDILGIDRAVVFGRPSGAQAPCGPGPGDKSPYVFSEVFDLKPTSGLYLKNSAHLSNFLTPRTVSAVRAAPYDYAQKEIEDENEDDCRTTTGRGSCPTKPLFDRTRLLPRNRS